MVTCMSTSGVCPMWSSTCTHRVDQVCVHKTPFFCHNQVADSTTALLLCTHQGLMTCAYRACPRGSATWSPYTASRLPPLSSLRTKCRLLRRLPTTIMPSGSHRQQVGCMPLRCTASAFSQTTLPARRQGGAAGRRPCIALKAPQAAPPRTPRTLRIPRRGEATLVAAVAQDRRRHQRAGGSTGKQQRDVTGGGQRRPRRARKSPQCCRYLASSLS